METIGQKLKRIGALLERSASTEESDVIVYRCRWCNRAIDKRRVMAAITRGRIPSFHSDNCKSYFYKRKARELKRKEKN